MKTHFNLFSPLLVFMMAIGNSGQTVAQVQKEIIGAWQLDENGRKTIILFQDGYCTYTEYRSNEFLMSRGGPYHVNGEQVEMTVEFNSVNKAEVGQPLRVSFSLNDDELQLSLDGEAAIWKRLDAGLAPLAGVWQITEREQEGKLVSIHRTGSRKTLKILTGTRFQWFAINPETKEFSGTGGGTYSFSNGKYTEHIEFFSRDNSRVGASLSFDGKLVMGKWHHSGLSSTGNKIYEVWSKVK